MVKISLRRLGTCAAAAVVVLASLGVGATEVQAATYSGTAALSADRTQLDTGTGPTARLSLTFSASTAGVTWAVYDETGVVVWKPFWGSGTVNVPVNKSRTYTAYVMSAESPNGPPASGVYAVSTPVTITNVGFVGTASLSADRTQLDTGTGPTARLSLTFSAPTTGVTWAVYDEAGVVVWKPFWGSGNVYVKAGASRTFTAYVMDAESPNGPPTSGVRAASAPVTITNIPPADNVGGMSLAALSTAAAARFATELEFCVAAGEVSQTHYARSSVSDATLACEAGGIRGLVAFLEPLIGATGTGLVLWQLVYGHDSGAGSQIDTKPPAPRAGSQDAAATAMLTGSLLRRLDVSDGPSETRTPNSLRPFVAAQAARVCLDQAARLAGAIAADCDRLTIFIPGANAGEAARNDRDAINGGAPWLLHYVSEDNNGLKREWYKRSVNQPNACGDPVPPGVSNPQCDEYPFYSTNEAGPANPLNPGGASLRIVPAGDNGPEGNALRWMPYHCGLDSGSRPDPPVSGALGSPYLVVPLPELVAVTTYVCGDVGVGP